MKTITSTELFRQRTTAFRSFSGKLSDITDINRQVPLFYVSNRTTPAKSFVAISPELLSVLFRTSGEAHCMDLADEIDALERESVEKTKEKYRIIQSRRLATIRSKEYTEKKKKLAKLNKLSN